ncbi:MAG: hypothetical protein D6730_19130 [Bacteroidetes bacterium]|nr:MAG: hypothetical protein D6730_19130 [Bacteroidota bacterium]
MGTSEELKYFWYFSDGFFSTEARPTHTFITDMNQVHEVGVMMARGGDPDPVVGGMPSEPKIPPIDPTKPDNLRLHVSAMDAAAITARLAPSQNGGTPVLKLQFVKQNNLVVAVLTYRRNVGSNMPDSGFFRISFNHTRNVHTPLLLRQEPIVFHNEWVQPAAPAANYRQALYVGYRGLAEGSERTLFIPFWGIYAPDALGQPALDLNEEAKVEWLMDPSTVGTGTLQPILQPLSEIIHVE